MKPEGSSIKLKNILYLANLLLYFSKTTGTLKSSGMKRNSYG